jgi:uncharacterized protein (TIGR00251 family)
MVKVTPNAKQNAVIGFHENILKVRIQAPPDKGKANEKLIEFLAEIFNIPKSQIQIISGHASRLKRVEFFQDVDLTKYYI